LADADEQMANNLAERLRKVLAQPFSLSQGATAQIGASVGYALWGEGIDSTEDLFRAADQAMYRDKLLQQQAANPPV
jgi:GGDEF domain-containing protein